jgi:hypothetical protein
MTVYQLARHLTRHILRGRGKHLVCVYLYLHADNPYVHSVVHATSWVVHRIDPPSGPDERLLRLDCRRHGIPPRVAELPQPPGQTTGELS